MHRQSTLRIGLLLTVALAGLAASLRLLPAKSLSAGIPKSRVITAQNGDLLRLTLATDGQYRVWAPLARMPSRLPAAVILYEDRWFYEHPGVNPLSFVRAARSLWRGGRRLGASTISMQLARRLYSIDTRNTRGKFLQIAGALWLEARYGKADILEAYLNLAPYGHNIEGIGAASLVYFGRPVSELAVPQLMSLAVIPQNPRSRRLVPSRGPQTASPSVADIARRRLWCRWLQNHPEDSRFSGEVAATVYAGGAAALPFLAPHFTDAILRQTDGDAHTSLDPLRQRTLERMIRLFVAEHSGVGIRNAGALLLEMDGRGIASVRAYVGSADYRNADIDGQVNAVTARRSVGSTLKPFVYALGLDQGLLHPRTILKDTPSSFGAFSPENFDGRFMGPIAAEEALVHSRNVPAVAVAAQLSHPNLYDFLRSAEIAHLDTERHYGLALALGAGEISMEELGRMYAIFLNGGRLPALDHLASRNSAPLPGLQLLSDEAGFITLGMLQKNPRPDTGQPASPAVAWKTGTSWGFHDAWSVAVFGRCVLVVWIGNFDNTANPAFVGVQAAAPLMFRIIDAIRSEGLDPGGQDRPAPRNIARISVCAASGDLPNADCPETVATWFIPGKSPIRVSKLHRGIYLDASGRRVCAPGPGIHREVFEFWSSDLQRLFSEAGMPRRVAPAAPDCRSGAATDDPFDARDAPQIVSPLRGVVYTLRLASPQPLALRANIAGRTKAIYWFADKSYLGRAEHGEAFAWLPPQPGHFLLRAIDDAGVGDSRNIDIEVVP